MSNTYEVIVGNVGNVLNTKSHQKAREVFEDYSKMSIDNYGRVAGEPVFLMLNGEVLREQQGVHE